jgi:hypothetical protein
MATVKNIVFTDWFKSDYVAASPVVTWTTVQQVNVKLYTRNPLLTDAVDAKFAAGSYRSLSDFDNDPQWVPISSALTSKANNVAANLYVKKNATSKNLQLTRADGTVAAIETNDGWFFSTAGSQDVVSAAVFYLTSPVTYGGSTITNPVLFATTQGIGAYTVAITGAVFGQSNSQVTTNQYIVKAITNTIGETTYTTLSEGCTLLYLSAPTWEPAHSQHIWIQPQRVNYIANPSLEKSLSSPARLAYWRTGRAIIASGSTTSAPNGSSVTVTKSTGGVDPNRSFFGTFNSESLATNEKTIIESNLFPKTNNWYSISFWVSATSASGALTYGLVGRTSGVSGAVYLRAYNGTVTTSDNTKFVNFRALINVPDEFTDLQFRIESGNSNTYVDNVLVDPHEGQYDYFDGYTTDGLVNDFHWMGGSTNYANSHFSIWYNNYMNTRSRLIGDYDTTEGVYKAGLVEEWAPTGSNVVAHWDAVTSITPRGWSGDSFYKVVDLSQTPVSTITSTIDTNDTSLFPALTSPFSTKDKIAIEAIPASTYGVSKIAGLGMDEKTKKKLAVEIIG